MFPISRVSPVCNLEYATVPVSRIKSLLTEMISSCSQVNEAKNKSHEVTLVRAP